MKYIVVLILLFLGGEVGAVENFCGDIQRMRTWLDGNDAYGVWLEFESNPDQCSGGFYLKQEANNRELVYSTLLAAKMAKQKICIQVYSHTSDIGNRCLLHYVYHP